jgi:hypothetical protein
VEAEVCFICASPVVHNSLAPCNHRTCHICALRLRALYKTKACAHCRVSESITFVTLNSNLFQSEAKFVIFTDDAVKRFEDFGDKDFDKVDDVLGIKYQNKEIFDDAVLLLRYNCPEGDCDVACYGWPDLHRHVRNIHHKVMCDLCTRNKKVFTHEHDLFTREELKKHEKFGDDNPGAIDQSGFKGHPECGFCRQRFYGDDELYTHCRDRHERCHVCDRRNPGRQPQYYVDYNSLEEHFKKDHFLCLDQECLDKKFVVFGSEMDLKAHQLETHPNELSKDARKDARRVDISAFDYRAPLQGDRGGRGRGRGRDPDTEPLPASTAQPLRRDEIAYQRQMAIQSAQSVTSRTFGGHLTAPDPSTSRPGGRNQQQAVTATVNGANSAQSPPPMDSLNLNSHVAAPEGLTPQDQARRLQHAAVMDRASAMLHHDPSKTAGFRSRVSSYRTSAITASELVDTLLTLFDGPTAELGKLVKELADIYENEAKRSQLLQAWHDWRAIHEDYPSLPGAGGVLPAASAGGGGRRILTLKSSTAQSSRSAVSRQRSWGHTAAVTPFPVLPAAPTSRAGRGKVGPTPWAHPSAPRPMLGPSRPASTAPSGGGAGPASDAFPALPAAAKPNTTIFGLHRGAVAWNDGRSQAPAHVWGGSTSADASAAASEAEEEGAGAGKRKGKQGKKQTLYRFG